MKRKTSKSYDQAVAKRKDLSQKKRVEMIGMKTIKPDADIHAVLTPAYTLTEISQHPVGDDIEHLIEARLVPNATRKSKCPWRFQLWVSEKNAMLDRYEADVPGDQTPSCHDAHDIVTYTLVDGLPKLSRLSTRFYPLAPSRETAVDDFLFTNYRRFNTTVTMHTGEVVDDPTPTPPK